MVIEKNEHHTEGHVPQHCHIVLIDHSDEDHKRIHTLLQGMEHYHLTTYQTAREAFQHRDRLYKADCILLDYDLKDMPGLDCLVTLTAHPDAPPVVILSSASDKTITKRALEQGAKDCFFKENLTLSALKRCITNAISTHNLSTELDDRNEEARQFALVLAHDMKSPLRVISLLSEQISKDLYSDHFDQEHAKDLFTELNQNIGYIRRLVNGLVGFVQHGREQHIFTQIDLNDLVKRVVSAISYDHDKTKPDISIGRLPIVTGDKTGLTQVFQNIIDNAVKYNKNEKKIITISSEETPITYNIKIQDNGIGIDPLYFEKIFQPMIRLHNSSQYEGSGIGLALVKKIVEQHHGQISVESCVDQGSTFIINLPKP